MQQGAQLQRAIRALERPIFPPGHSPMHERLADAFLKNAAEKNAADPRLAPAQAIVGAAVQAARGRGESARAIEATGESTRSEEHTSELQSIMRIAYAVFCLK